MNRVKRLAAIAAVGLGGIGPGCAGPPEGFDSPEPAARIRAITRAAREEDRSAIPDVVESLDSDDPAVRLIAIRALEKLTGTTRGYDHADAEWRRREAVDRWVAWLESGAEVP